MKQAVVHNDVISNKMQARRWEAEELSQLVFAYPWYLGFRIKAKLCICYFMWFDPAFESFVPSPSQLLLVDPCLFVLHFWCSRCPFLAVVRVNSAPQSGQEALEA